MITEIKQENLNFNEGCLLHEQNDMYSQLPEESKLPDISMLDQTITSQITLTEYQNDAKNNKHN